MLPRDRCTRGVKGAHIWPQRAAGERGLRGSCARSPLPFRGVYGLRIDHGARHIPLAPAPGTPPLTDVIRPSMSRRQRVDGALRRSRHGPRTLHAVFTVPRVTLRTPPAAEDVESPAALPGPATGSPRLRARNPRRTRGDDDGPGGFSNLPGRTIRPRGAGRRFPPAHWSSAAGRPTHHPWNSPPAGPHRRMCRRTTTHRGHGRTHPARTPHVPLSDVFRTCFRPTAVRRRGVGT